MTIICLKDTFDNGYAIELLYDDADTDYPWVVFVYDGSVAAGMPVETRYYSQRSVATAGYMFLCKDIPRRGPGEGPTGKILS